jgi:ribosomal protein L37E
MSDLTRPASSSTTHRPDAGPDDASKAHSRADDKVLCERCGAKMYRMHAVWRCPDCGFKTDCCGW